MNNIVDTFDATPRNEDGILQEIATEIQDINSTTFLPEEYPEYGLDVVLLREVSLIMDNRKSSYSKAPRYDRKKEAQILKMFNERLIDLDYKDDYEEDEDEEGSNIARLDNGHFRLQMHWIKHYLMPRSMPTTKEQEVDWWIAFACSTESKINAEDLMRDTSISDMITILYDTHVPSPLYGWNAFNFLVPPGLHLDGDIGRAAVVKDFGDSNGNIKMHEHTPGIPIPILVSKGAREALNTLGYLA